MHGKKHPVTLIFFFTHSSLLADEIFFLWIVFVHFTTTIFNIISHFCRFWLINTVMSFALVLKLGTFRISTWANPSNTMVFIGLLQDIYVYIALSSPNYTWVLLGFNRVTMLNLPARISSNTRNNTLQNENVQIWENSDLPFHIVFIQSQDESSLEVLCNATMQQIFPIQNNPEKSRSIL